MKKSLFLIFTATVVFAFASSCKKTCANGSQVSTSANCDTVPTNNNSGSLTGTWTKAGPSGSGINYVIIIDDNTKTTRIGYNMGSGFTQTQTGSYTRTNTQIVITDGSCPGVAGTYNFTVNSTTLTYALVSDNCVDANFGGNRSASVAGAWTRQ